MTSKTTLTVHEIFAAWRAEDEQLGREVDSLRQWMRELDQLGKQHFGETATRLRLLRETIVDHFDREEVMMEKLSAHYPPSSPELAAVKKQAKREHQNLLARLDDLVNRLDQVEPPFESWQQAMDEMQELVNLFEHHEANEWESIEMLLPA